MFTTAAKPAPSLARKTSDLPVGFVADLDVASHALMDGMDGVIWRRQVPVEILNWLQNLPAPRLPEGRYVLKPADVSACLADMFAANGLSMGAEAVWLCSDIQQLAAQVSSLTDHAWVRLRLEAVSNNACSKFHVDNIVARMICTYRGPGTQLSSDKANHYPIFEVETGQPILLKGKQWGQARDVDLRHRSPPIAGTGLTRWLLVLEGCDRSEIIPEYDEIYRDLNLKDTI